MIFFKKKHYRGSEFFVKYHICRLQNLSRQQNRRADKFKNPCLIQNIITHLCTHGDKNLHTLLVKHYNDLLDGQSSERSIDKVTYFYGGKLFCIHLGIKYANFQEKKSFRGFPEKSSKLFIVVKLLQ